MRMRVAVAAAVVLTGLCGSAFGYSVLTHQAVVDAAWEDSIRTLLLRRYPALDAEQLRQAHAFAYGGCLIQDMGYYPMGRRFFTDLVHYVRSGDFVVAMLREARDANEYAFALGALAHYASDNTGHPGINRSVAIVYPKLRGQFGPEVTYAQKPSAHLKVEFGFDVLQVARGRYAPDVYRDIIGFEVSKPLLERAFKDTYGVGLDELFAGLDTALGTYRFAAGSLIPQMTKVAWAAKKDEIDRLAPGTPREKFVFRFNRREYEKKWGTKYERPGLFARFLAFLFRILPKIGPLRGLAFHVPTAEAERLFAEGFNQTLERYRSLLEAERRGDLRLPNMDFDTGKPTRPGEYPLADRAYARLLEHLASHDFKDLSPELRADITSFFQDTAALEKGQKSRKDRKEWRKTSEALERLKGMKQVAVR
jgi:zinc dependent phospholipase C